MFKTILAWIIAIVVAIIAIQMIFGLMGIVLSGIFTGLKILVFVVPVIIIAFPVYLIVKKKFLK